MKDLYNDNKLNTHQQNHLTILMIGEVTNNIQMSVNLVSQL